jgi:hypothetical protein
VDIEESAKSQELSYEKSDFKAFVLRHQKLQNQNIDYQLQNDEVMPI